MTAAARFYARLEPLAYNDDGTLEDFTTALMAPVEICEVSRDTDTLVAYESLFDPDTCPEELLNWLANYNGVTLPASALTADDKRYRIKQAAGRYRGTPRALAEEIQLTLTGTKTVLLGYHNGDEWHYLVGTIDAETPDTAAVEAAVERQNPAFMLGEYVSSTTWSYFVLGPTFVATRTGDEFSFDPPTYPDYQSLIDAFSDYQHVLDNDPNL